MTDIEKFSKMCEFITLSAVGYICLFSNIEHDSDYSDISDCESYISLKEKMNSLLIMLNDELKAGEVKLLERDLETDIWNLLN